MPKEMGLLVKVEDVRRTWANIAVMIKTRVLAIPNRYAVQLVNEPNPNIIADVLTKAVYEALQAIADEDLKVEEQKKKLNIQLPTQSLAQENTNEKSSQNKPAAWTDYRASA